MSKIVSAQIDIPALSPASTLQQQVGLSNVTISFHRPSLRGRKLLGQPNIPFGKVWRLGANEITTIEVSDTIEIDNKTLPKGKYAMVAIPNKKDWTIIINKDADQWGVYDYADNKDVMRFNVKATTLSTTQEIMNFTFDSLTLNSATLIFAWQNTSFKIKFSQNIDSKVMTQIKAKTNIANPDALDLMYAVEYYLMMNRDLEQALIWIDMVLAKVQSPFRYNLKAQVAQRLGKCKDAVDAAKKAIEYATENGDLAAIALAEEIIKNCKPTKK
jgi:Protein of unknown function (DUF2911)